MMMSHRSNTFTGFVILILVTLISASNECPEDCVCSRTEFETTLNHAKCASLIGLKGEEKHTPIHSLDLSDANLLRVSHTLEKLKDVVKLNLSHNNLSDIGRLGRRIKSLDLSHNKITSGKLRKLPHHVVSLDLSFNEITFLPLEVTMLGNLKTINLIGNSINCTCETLEVRDWIQRNNISSDETICTYPTELKGHRWLDVNKNEVCPQHKSSVENKNNHNDEDNELMMGDQPLIHEGSGNTDDVDELSETFIPVAKIGKKLEEIQSDDDGEDASGNGPPIQIHTEEDEDEGSGSGGGLLRIIHLPTENDHSNGTSPEDEGNDEEIGTTVTSTEEPSDEDVFGHGLGIIEMSKYSTTTEAEEGEIVPIHVQEAAAAPHDEVSEDEDETEDAEATSTTNGDDGTQNASIKLGEEGEEALKGANTSENKGTYILMGIVLVLLVGLIVFVAVKRTKANKRSNRDRDPEIPRATELQDMDKKNLGKPIHKNGNTEHVPLINDRNKADLAKPVNGSKKVPYVPHEDNDGKAQEPLLNRKEESDGKSESNNNETRTNQQVPKTEEEIPKPSVRHSLEKQPQEGRKGGYPPPKSPRTKKPSTGDDDVFLPSSPKTSRYSPVYSPETGRVKIKLTETPKPKTPLLVTRSKSNAGEIVTTPTPLNQVLTNQ